MKNIFEPREEFNKNTVVAFDVDMTLITEDYKPIYENIQLFHLFKKLGCHMVIWSGGGVDYAARWAEKLGLEAEICVKASFKPDIVFDDMDYEWEGNVVIKV